MQNIQEDHQGKNSNIILSKHILILGFVSMKSDSSRMIMSINDPKGREIDRQMGEYKMEKKFGELKSNILLLKGDLLILMEIYLFQVVKEYMF